MKTLHQINPFYGNTDKFLPELTQPIGRQKFYFSTVTITPQIEKIETDERIEVEDDNHKVTIDSIIACVPKSTTIEIKKTRGYLPPSLRKALPTFSSLFDQEEKSKISFDDAYPPAGQGRFFDPHNIFSSHPQYRNYTGRGILIDKDYFSLGLGGTIRAETKSTGDVTKNTVRLAHFHYEWIARDEVLNPHNIYVDIGQADLPFDVKSPLFHPLKDRIREIGVKYLLPKL